MLTLRPDRPYLAILAAALLVLLTSEAYGTPKTATPRLQDRVTDLARVFSAEQRTRLIKELAAFERETSHQMAVLTVPTLSGERIEDFSLRVANDWGLGQKGKDNGILVTLALKERQVRIELGKGLESDIPQETLDRIIQDDMVPAFRRGDYAGGLEKGVRRLQEVAPRSTVALDCEVDVRVEKVVRQEKVTAEIAEALHFEKDAIGLGVTLLEATVVNAAARPQSKDNGCAELVSEGGKLVVRYKLSDKRAGTLAPGKVVRLRLWALPGFAPYGVPGTEIWTFL